MAGGGAVFVRLIVREWGNARVKATRAREEQCG
jgi:hypothetical protein